MLTNTYWENRYQEGSTGWDMGHPSPAITKYIDQLTDKNIKILIPGCGRGYEAEYLYTSGFKNVYILDFASSSLKDFSKRVPEFPKEQLICEDYFTYQNTFDLIIEQTFFCALHPEQRAAYALHTKQLLRKNGKIAGLLFNKEFAKEGPPFGGTREEYTKLFSSLFTIKTLDECYNSIAPRSGNELFFIFENS